MVYNNFRVNIQEMEIDMKKTDNRNISIALLGAGTVGGGVYKLIKDNQEEFKDRTGALITVKKVLVKDITKDRPGFEKSVLTDDFNEIINDKDIEIVVELMGGIHPALDYVTESLKAGKQVVTANKDLIAEYGELIGNLAEQMGSDLLFEAAVAGAIPIIRPLKQSMAGNNVSEIMGIVNGTTNYILTKMSETGMSYADALAKATELGYAEADPTADVEGYDAGRKVAIMATIAFHSRVVFNQVYTEGITKISSDDIRYAKEFGYVIKLVGVAKQTEDGIEAKVHPMLIPEDHPLAGVRDSYNAVFVHGDAMEDITFMGRGAGQMPTASAVMGDVIDVCRDLVYDSCGRVGCNCYKKLPVKKIEDSSSKFFLRILAEDRPGVLANIASVLGNNDVSIAQVVQKSGKCGTAELVIITDSVVEKNFNDAMAVFAGMSVVKDIPGVIRVY